MISTIQRCAVLLLGLLLAPMALAASDDGPDIRHNIVLPAKPASKHTLHVCAGGEIPGCFPSIGKALADAPHDDVRLVVHCGHYRGDTAELTGFSNLVIEGVPCPNGRLPVLNATGVSTLRMGAYPWLGQDSSKNLWLEGLELRSNHVGGNGTPVRVGGAGYAMFKNVYVNENDNGILVDPLFAGTIYIVDSAFRDNGYGRRGRTHHVYASCEPPCRLVVLDSYFGKVLQGGSHLRVHGHVFAVGNMFIDEPGSIASRMIHTGDNACSMDGMEEPPCLVAENFMLKNQAAEHREFISIGSARLTGDGPKGMVIRNNAILGLRDGAILIGNKEPNATIVVRGNLLVVKDPGRCTGTGRQCLLTIPEFDAVLESNLISGDPDDLPTLFAGHAK